MTRNVKLFLEDKANEVLVNLKSDIEDAYEEYCEWMEDAVEHEVVEPEDCVVVDKEEFMNTFFSVSVKIVED